MHFIMTYLATYEQLAQYSMCTSGPDPLLLALVVFFHSQLAYSLYCHVMVLLLLALVVFSYIGICGMGLKV